MSRMHKAALIETKIMVAGDALVGKTSMMYSYVNNCFPQENEVAKSNKFEKLVTMDKKKFTLTLLEWDVSSISGIDCFLIAFAINNITSFENVRKKLYPEVRRHHPDAYIILVGTKCDLRESNEDKSVLVCYPQALSMSKEIMACSYVECSALSRVNLNEVFIETLKCVHAAVPKPRHHKRALCQII